MLSDYLTTILIFISSLTGGWYSGDPIFGAPISTGRIERSIVPETDSQYYLGTTTPSTVAWASGIFDQLCLTGDSCQTSWPTGGGSGGGTWSTTTSQVSGQLINYPNNTDDVVAIGSNSTTTAEFYFDPNLPLASISSGFLDIQGWRVSTSTTVCAVGCEYTSIQTAISDGWDYVRLKDETYTLSSAITIPRNNITIEAEAPRTTVSFNAATVPVAFTNSDYATQRTGTVVKNILFNQTGGAGIGTCIDFSNMALGYYENVDCAGALYGYSASTSGAYYNTIISPVINVSGTGSRGFNLENEDAIFTTIINPRVLTGTDTVGYYIDAHALHCVACNAETNALIGMDITANGNDAQLDVYLEGNQTNLRLASGVEGVNITGFIADADDTTIGNILDNGSRGTTIDARVQYEPMKAYMPGTTTPIPFAIGATSSPVANTHQLISGSHSSIFNSLLLNNTGAFSAGEQRLVWGNSSGAGYFPHAAIGSVVGSSYASPALMFHVGTSTRSLNLAERMRIDVDGDLGIGTTSPYAKLSVVGETVASHFTATTSSTSTLPVLSVQTALDFFGTFANSLDDLCVAITGGAGLCDGSDADSGAGTGSNWQFSGLTAITPTSTVGIIANASSTIGNGTPTGGLTVSGNATTTGTIVGGGYAVILPAGISSPAAFLTASTTGRSGVILGNNGSGAAPEFRFVVYDPSSISEYIAFGMTNSNAATPGTLWGLDKSNLAYILSNTARDMAIGPASVNDLYFAAGDSANAPDVTLSGQTSTNGNLGIGTTSPYAKLSVVGEAVARNFTATSTTATSTFAGPVRVLNLGVNKNPATGRLGEAFIDGTTITSGIRTEADSVSRITNSNFITGDSQLRFTITADGDLDWGGGSAVPDTNLFRDSANVLRTNHSLLVDKYLGVGTTTPKWPVQIASSTGPQLTLSDGSASSNHWSFRNAGSILYIGTSSPSTFSTSTRPFITMYGSTGTTTIMGPISATSSTYIYSTAASKGAEIIMEDSDGAGCTAIMTLNGVITGATVTCPAEI